MVIPDHIAAAAQIGDIATVREWLETHDVNDTAFVHPPGPPNWGRSHYDEATLLGIVAGGFHLGGTDAHSAMAAGDARMELARMLLDRGADATLPDTVGYAPLHKACEASSSGSAKLVTLLLGAEGVQGQINLKTRVNRTPLCCAFGNFRSFREHLHVRRLVTVLLRAGASLDAIQDSNSAEDELDFYEHKGEALLLPPEGIGYLELLEDFVACKKMIHGIRVAGSWQAWNNGPRKQVLRLRSLALRGRAKLRGRARTRTKDLQVIDFLVKSPNEIAWNVLAYWRTERDEWLVDV